jgi:hypothetical protein
VQFDPRSNLNLLMKNLWLKAKLTLLCICSFSTTFSQINFTANDFGQVPPYNGFFMYGTNMGYYGPSWDNHTLANIAAGNPALNVPGVGSKSFRIPLPEEFVEYWGYDVAIGQYNYYSTLGIKDNTLFLNDPAPWHQDPSFYNGCNVQSVIWSNLYTPIWDGGANGTPVNENNYYALYVYKIVTRYKNWNKFYEILNEPDYDLSGNAWKNRGEAGNWWDNNPNPCHLYNMRAPIFHYIRMLRISYEVIKSVDPTAYITVGGLGYPSFLDAILRNTDNPNGGAVTAEYPLKGGAYFDVLSFHNYPMYGLSYWDNSIPGFAYKRHSDAAVEKFIELKTSMQTVLATHGYNNTSFPQKHFICTENNIPSKEIDGYIGSEEAEKNYVMKALVESQRNDIRQFYLFTLGDAKHDYEAATGYELMGLYKKLEGRGPLSNNGNYGQQYKDAGIGFRTTSEQLLNYRFDNARTAAMALPATIGGAAFRNDAGKYRYVLWAKTTVDRSENASATYSFPASSGFPLLLYKRDWNHSVTGITASIQSTGIALSGSPIFLEDNLQIVPLREPDSVRREAEKKLSLIVYPNPASKNASLRFTLTSPTKVRIDILDVQGKLVKQLPVSSQLSSGTHTIPLTGIESLPSGVYYCRFETDIIQLLRKITIVR